MGVNGWGSRLCGGGNQKKWKETKADESAHDSPG